MDHLRISGTESSLVIFSQRKKFQKLERDVQKVTKNKLKLKGWCNKPTKLQFQWILTWTILMLSNATNQPKSTVEFCFHSGVSENYFAHIKMCLALEIHV